MENKSSGVEAPIETASPLTGVRSTDGLCSSVSPRNIPQWNQDTDENGNDFWMASSPYEEGFQWILKQRLADNRIEWYEDHDAELMSDDGPLSWPDLGQAKEAIAQAHANIIADNPA